MLFGLPIDSLITLLVFFGIVNACFCSNLAARKGYFGTTPALLGFFFSIMALLYYVGMPETKTEEPITYKIEYWDEEAQCFITQYYAAPYYPAPPPKAVEAPPAKQATRKR